MEKSDSDILSKFLAEKREKDKEVKKIIILYSSSSSGIKDIKDILNIENVQIKYLGSSQFSVSMIAKDFKNAENLVNEAIKEIEKRAKEKKADFELKEKI